MNILVSNDDGVFAPGIQALIAALKPLGRVVVVAPESERSGYSSALTLDRPLRPVQVSKDIWAVNGTPADCVYLATKGMFDFEFDLVVSGINSGANLGDDILYSGTVGAAFEGRLLQQPAIAVSLAGAKVRGYSDAKDFAIAAKWVHDFILNGLPNLPSGHILNINIPDGVDLKGYLYTYQGRRHLLNPIMNQVDPKGRKVFWIGLAADEIIEPKKNDIYSDFYAVKNGFVSITPIQIDATNYQTLKQLNDVLVQ